MFDGSVPADGGAPIPFERAQVTLTEYLESLKTHVAEFAASWVTAEVISAGLRGNVFYFELADSDVDGRQGAKTTAKLWRNREAVLREFREGAGENPKAGMRILARVRPTFHPQYGLTLDIEKIDPYFTRGDIERRCSEIREKLKAANHFDRQRAYPCPTDFRRVAVISPTDAAALGDFREVADRLHRSTLCQFTYHTAFFQGSQAADTIVAALIEVVKAHKQDPFCAVCIIRGGGSVTDLAELNQLKIALVVCCAPLPVLTGIGHEKDTGLLDEIASRRFDTPSKVALYIENAIRQTARETEADWQTVRREAQRVVTSAQREIETLRVRVSEHGVAAANTAARALEGDRQYIALSAEAALPRARQTLDEAYGSLRGSADRVLQAARKSLTSDMEQIVGLGPGHTLARGFAIVRDGDQRVVTRSGGAGNDLTIEFADGRVPVRRAKIGD